MRKTSLKDMLRKGRLIATTGIYDMISMRNADRMGFGALYITGCGTVASHLGLPDAGLASYTDMVDRVRAMCAMADRAYDTKLPTALKRSIGPVQKNDWR